jgi:AraC-like DNA-binding protein
VFGVLASQFYFKSSNEKLELLGTDSALIDIIRISDFIFSLQIVLYNIAAILKYYGYRKRVKDLTNNRPQYDAWIRIAIFTFLVACLITVTGKILGYINEAVDFNTFYASNIAFLFFYSILFFVSITSPSLIMASDKKEKYWYSNLSDFESKELLYRLNGYINETQIYRKSGLSLKELASGIGVSERHLSQAINDQKGQNFFDFVNYYRVEHAKRLLVLNNDNKRTMFDIFWESGFNSKTTFNTAFKKFTGITPTEFQKSSLDK